MIPGFILFNPRNIMRNEQVRNLRHRGRQAVAICVSIAMLSISSLVAFGSPSSIAKEATGLVTINGTVAINGTRAESGQTLFSGSTIRTDTESESLVNLRNSGRLKLGSETTLNLDFSESTLSGSLTRGSVDCASPKGVGAEIMTADGAIVADPVQSAQFRIQVEECNTNLSVQSGHVGIRTGEKVRWVAAGETFSTADASAPMPQQNLNGKKKAALIIVFGSAAAIIAWIIIHNHHKNCTTVVSGTASSTTCQ
jgi:hypothetical protein